MRLRHLSFLIALMAGLILALLALGGAAQAADGIGDESSVTVTGRLVNRDAGYAEPVADAVITVTTVSGEVLRGVSRADGTFAIDVPAEMGEITIELDESSLPEGVTLRDDKGNPIIRTVTGTLPITVTFVLGPGNRQTTSVLEQIPQILYNGLYFGAVIALGALGLSLIFGTTGLTNFAHGEMVTFGALVTYGLNVALSIDIWLAALLAIVMSGVFGFYQDALFWRRLRRRGTGLVAMMIISIGVQFVLRNTYQFFTGGRTENYRQYTIPEGHELLGVTYTIRDLVCILIAAAMVIGVTVALKLTRWGQATRAVADNQDLAASTGINVDRVISGVWVVGAMLAGACGVVLGFSQAVKFDLGAQQLLVRFAAITVGGLGSVWGAVLGSLLVGVLIEMSTLFIPSELKIAAALFVLIAVLVVRPQGLLVRAARVG